MDETLKRLLNAEMEAEKIVALANEERQSIIDQAKSEALMAEQQHAQHVAEFHSSLLVQAEQRAKQTIATIERHYEELTLTLRASANRNEKRALDAALSMLTGVGQKK